MNNKIVFPKEFLYSDFEYSNELKKLVDEYSKTEKSTHFFEIISDDDLNKSKFINELKKSINATENNIFITSGNIYLKQFPWQPFGELLYNFFKLRKDQNLREKLFKFTKNFKEDMAMQNIYLSELFSKNEDNRKINLNNQTIFEAFRLFFLYTSKIKKTILILENIDNFDELSLGLLDYLIRTLKNHNVFFVITKKTRFQWNPKNIESKKIELKNISEFNALQILKKITEAEPDENLFKTVYEESKGNFFYLLLLINFLKENNCLIYEKNSVSLKENYKNLSSIPNLILLKINNLNLEEKELLSVASILGNKINYDILKKIIDKESLDLNLEKLVDLGFFHIEQIEQEKVIYFYAYEIMDFVYQNISPNNKREIHLKIAEVLQKEYSNNLSNIYEIIAYHYENASSDIDACYFYFMSGKIQKFKRL